MARQPKLRAKDGYWYSEAGGRAKRYGRVGVVSFEDALRAFHADLAARPVNPAANPALNPAPQDLATSDLMGGFLNWVLEHRGTRAYETRQLHLLRWADHYGHLRPARQASNSRTR